MVGAWQLWPVGLGVVQTQPFTLVEGRTMTLLHNYITRSVAGAIFVVLLVIVALDGISELVDQLGQIHGAYTFTEVLLYVALTLPAGVYDYLPLAALVGCLVGLGMLASSSELVVMRAAGVSQMQILTSVMRPVLGFIMLGVFLGEFVTPFTDQYGESRKALILGRDSAITSGQGMWNREGNEYMHFAALLPNGNLIGVSRFEFNEEGRLQRASYAQTAEYQRGQWQEQNGQYTELGATQINAATFDTRPWASALNPMLLQVLMLGKDNLPMLRLYSYANYLDEQAQDGKEYWLAFWKKALQPLAITSLVMIAISFIFGPLRQVAMGTRVFGGVMVGIGFRTSQDLLGPSSLLFGFPPVFAVLLPIILCAVIGIVLLRRSA
jgi:lipopolysaccharide export system permease protein